MKYMQFYIKASKTCQNSFTCSKLFFCWQIFIC